MRRLITSIITVYVIAYSCLSCSSPKHESLIGEWLIEITDSANGIYGVEVIDLSESDSVTITQDVTLRQIEDGFDYSIRLNHHINGIWRFDRGRVEIRLNRNSYRFSPVRGSFTLSLTEQGGDTLVLAALKPRIENEVIHNLDSIYNRANIQMQSDLRHLHNITVVSDDSIICWNNGEPVIMQRRRTIID